MNMHPADKLLELDDDEMGYLLEEIQLSFWIDFTERDIIEALTVGDLFDRVVNKMGYIGPPRCLTSAAFYRLRRSLSDVSGVDQQSIRRDTPLRILLSRSMQCEWWKVIERDLRLRIPSLRIARIAFWVYFSIATVSVAAVMITLSRSWEGQFIMPIPVLLLIWGLAKGTSCLPRELPVETLEELVRGVVTLNNQKLAREAGGTTVSQSWTAFRELVSGISGMPAAAVNREMRFPQDLRVS